MRGYEICIIIHGETSEEDTEKLLNRVKASVSKNQGDILKTDNWGKKKLQYPIKNQTKANFYFLYCTGDKKVLSEIEHILRFDENVLRFQMLRINNLESIKLDEQPMDTLEIVQEPDDITKEDSVSFTET